MPFSSRFSPNLIKNFFFFFFKVGRLMDMHGETGTTVSQTATGEAGQAVDRPDGYEPPIQKAV